MATLRLEPKGHDYQCHMCGSKENVYTIDDMTRCGGWTIFCEACLKDLWSAMPQLSDKETIGDLHYISEYAKTLREQLLNKECLVLGYLNRMTELANQVHKRYNNKTGQ